MKVNSKHAMKGFEEGLADLTIDEMRQALAHVEKDIRSFNNLRQALMAGIESYPFIGKSS